MEKHDSLTTREKIMAVAAKMFSERGYDKVTTREIANAIGINSASIYYHFPSKADIIKSLYAFYSENRQKSNPDVCALLALAETEHPYIVLGKTEYHFIEDIRVMMDQILVTASREICTDTDCENFIRENIFDNIETILRPLLERMIELKKIEPLDIDTFLRVLSNYCYSTAVLNNTVFRQDVSEYQAGMAFLFSYIKPTGT